jgi:uncharacterized delta-60 repeat protein
MQANPRMRRAARVPAKAGARGPILAGLALLACLAPVQRAVAHAGDLDPAFGNGGIAYVPLAENGSCLSGANAVAVHPDGSIWVAGWSRDARLPERDAAFVRLDDHGRVVYSHFGYEQSELRAIAIEPATGSIYLAGNQGNVATVRALASDGSFDAAFGNDGVRGIAVGGDTGHQTTVNDLRLDAGGSLYLAGGYNGSGVQQLMLAYLTPDGTLQAAEALGGDIAGFTATSLAIQPPDGRLLASGYSAGACATAAYDVTFSSGFHFTPDPGYSSPPYGFSGTAACFVDAAALLDDGGSLVEAGRVLDGGGNWFAMWQKVDPDGALSQPGHAFNMSPWGDNSPRRVLPVPNGSFVESRWVIVGFTGVDPSGRPGAWAGRFDASGSLDGRFGNGGATLIDFDAGGQASGQALGATLDGRGRVVMAGTFSTGTSDAEGNDCSEIFVARLQGEDVIFIDGFDP